MTSEEKKDIYTMLEKASCWAYGYDSPTFKDDDILFEDDVYEYIETQEQIPQDAESINQKPEKISTDEKEISRLEILANKISSCTNCVLSRSRNSTVPGEGVENPFVLVIGEAPGEEDNITGKPFSGQEGQLLDKMLAAISLSRSTNTYITNLVKCTTPRERSPMQDEVSACQGFLQAQIHALKPKFILAMGRMAMQCLADTSRGMNAVRGQWLSWNNIPMMATFHPSSLIHDPRLKAPAWEDLKKFKERLLEESPEYAKEFFMQAK